MSMKHASQVSLFPFNSAWQTAAALTTALVYSDPRPPASQRTSDHHGLWGSGSHATSRTFSIENPYGPHRETRHIQLFQSLLQGKSIKIYANMDMEHFLLT